MAEETVGKYGNGHKGRVRLLKGAEVVSDPKLGNLELPVADHALHDLTDVVRAPQLQVDSLEPHSTIEQRARAVVIPTSQGELQIRHWTSLQGRRTCLMVLQQRNPDVETCTS